MSRGTKDDKTSSSELPLTSSPESEFFNEMAVSSSPTSLSKQSYTLIGEDSAQSTSSSSHSSQICSDLKRTCLKSSKIPDILTESSEQKPNEDSSTSEKDSKSSEYDMLTEDYTHTSATVSTEDVFSEPLERTSSNTPVVEFLQPSVKSLSALKKRSQRSSTSSPLKDRAHQMRERSHSVRERPYSLRDSSLALLKSRASSSKEISSTSSGGKTQLVKSLSESTDSLEDTVPLVQNVPSSPEYQPLLTETSPDPKKSSIPSTDKNVEQLEKPQSNK